MMLVLKDSRGLLPFYDEKPSWDCAPIYSGLASPSFFVANVWGATYVNLSTGQTFNSIAETVTITQGGESQIFTCHEAKTLPPGKYCVQLKSPTNKDYFSELFQITDCKTPYRLKAELLCDNVSLGPAGKVVDMGIEAANLTTIEAETISEQIIDNGYGQKLDESFKQRDLQTIDLWMTPGLKQVLSRLRMYDKVVLCCPDGTELELDPSSLSTSYASDPYKFSTGTLTFACKDAWLCKTSCCDPITIESTDDCNTDPTDPACNDCDVEITVAGNVLTMTETGTAPAGSPVVVWTKDGSYLATGNSINTNGVPGNYCLSVTYPDCPVKTDCHTVIDACQLFDISAAVAGCKIDAVANGIPDSDVINWEICDQDGTVVGTSLPLTVDEGGTYIIKAITIPSNCQAIESVVVIKTDNCVHSVSITKTDGILTGVIADCPDGSVTSGFWTSLQEDGSEPIVSTGLTYQPTETGCFTFHGVCDGCEKVVSIFCKVDVDKLQMEICNWDEMPTLEVEITNDEPIKICDTSTTDAGPDITKTIPPKE